MSSEPKQRSFSIEPGEKITPVMMYTHSMLVWGEVVTKEAIRVSTWLRTPMVPQYITVHDGRALYVGYSGASRQQNFQTLHVPTPQVIAFHLMPPAQDPLDYDPNEPHRKMEPMAALVGFFRFDAFVRMSSQTSLERYLDVTHEAFTGVYDVSITQPSAPNLGVIKASFVLLRRDDVLFSSRSSG